MKAGRSIQYTVRRIPAPLDKALRRRALIEGKSLNEITIEILSAGLQLEGQPLEHHDLDFAIGSWVHDPAVEKALSAQDRIDPELWT